MNQTQKTTWIQYFQYLHAQWCNTFADNLSIGKCVDKLLKDNVVITNYIDIFYRYNPFAEPVTNAFTIQFNIVAPDSTEFDADFVIGGNSLFTYGGEQLGVQAFFLEQLAASGFECFESDGLIYAYTYDPAYSFTEMPVINMTSSDPYTTLSATITSLENNLGSILDLINCLTLEEMCDIKERLLLLLNNNCNCN